MILLKKFTTEGNERYAKLFDEFEESEIPAQALSLSLDSRFTEDIQSPKTIREPKIRMEVGSDLWESIGPGSGNENLAQNELFWNWLAARVMKISLEQAEGSKIGARARWLAAEGALRSYRHLPFSAYLAFANSAEKPETAWSILCQPLATFSEVIEQVLSTRSLAGSVGVEVATLIYFDASQGNNKAGSSGKGPGTPRRLRSFLNQIQLTIDYKSLEAKEILRLLPKEFDRFLS